MVSKDCSNPTCTVQNPQPLTNFKHALRYKNNLCSICRTCENLAAKIRRSRNPEKSRASDKRSYDKYAEKRRQKSRGCRFKQKYWPHLTYKEALAEWDRLYAEQQGRCKICVLPKSLDVDHAHSDGRVRALLCNDCNTAVARVKESLELVDRLYAYIRDICLQKPG